MLTIVPKILPNEYNIKYTIPDFIKLNSGGSYTTCKIN